MKKSCELCKNIATIYCESDQARLCWTCDAKVHSANFLVARHSRCLLCHVCQSTTPWTASGLKLGPTLSVCEACFHGEEEEEEGEDESSDSPFDEESGGDDDDDEVDEEEENQVVPWSPETPPPAASSDSSSEESTDGQREVLRKRIRTSSDRFSNRDSPPNLTEEMVSNGNRSNGGDDETAYVDTSSRARVRRKRMMALKPLRIGRG